MERRGLTYLELAEGRGWDVTPCIHNPLMTMREDTFCLAVTEYAGNVGEAYTCVYGPHQFPFAKARELLARPEIVARVKQLQEIEAESTLISIGAHLIELARIRDLAKITGAVKVALSAEQSRGTVAGFYIGKTGHAVSLDGEGPSEKVAIVRAAILAANATT